MVSTPRFLIIPWSSQHFLCVVCSLSSVHFIRHSLRAPLHPKHMFSVSAHASSSSVVCLSWYHIPAFWAKLRPPRPRESTAPPAALRPATQGRGRCAGTLQRPFQLRPACLGWGVRVGRTGMPVPGWRKGRNMRFGGRTKNPVWKLMIRNLI